MRIALDASYTTSPEPTGIGVYSLRLIEHLTEIAPSDRLIFCYRPKQYLASRRQPLRFGRHKVLQWPLTTGADVFHALNQRLDFRPAKRVVTTFHDLFVMTGEYSTPEFRARFAKQARQAAGRSDLIIAVSEFTARQVEGLLNVSRERIRVVPHGVHMPGCHELPPRQQIILSVGALQKRKNLVRLIKAFETVSPQWRLVLAGAKTGYAAGEVLAAIDASPARARIEVTGYVLAEDLETLYNRASVFAFPSLDEGFGIPVLEAMAHGVPVITSNRSALPEVAGDAALLVDPDDGEEISVGLRRLTEDSNLRVELSNRGLSRSAKFSWQKSAELTYRAYKEAL